MPSPSTIQELSAIWLELYEVSLSEVDRCRQLRDTSIDRTLLLESIPAPRQPSHRPLHLLYTILTKLSGPWPTFALISCHTRVLQYLPENIKIGKDKEFSWLVQSTAELVKTSYTSFSEFLGNEPRPALRTTKADEFITHNGLSKFVDRFQLPCEVQCKPRVAIALPNGPLLAAVCIAVTTYYTSAPINPAAGPEQFRADVKQSGASYIMTTPSEYEKLKIHTWAAEDGIQVLFVQWDLKDEITLCDTQGQLQPSYAVARQANKPDDIGLILFTSGTSGTKKVVPLTVHSIISGIVFVINSWGLNPSEVCLNMMPLYHV